ncbi:MAG: adenine nucleotide alpha hydrolase family protein, partial [Pyrobaculum sp.]|nr:adenine nucleotide alpha hydrolase family protein [Pyrobaculum sp.]
TIRRYRLVETGDVIYVAVSGGKDSCAALALLKEYVETFMVDAEIRAFHINLGFKTSPKVEEAVRALAERLGVPLHVVNARDYLDIEAAAKASRRPICSVCGAVKRYLMNKVPRELGATKVATGHHAHDLLAYYFKNLAGRNFQWNFKILPKVEGRGLLLTKIRPLIYARPEENEEFCRAGRLPVSAVCCEYGLCNAAHAEVYEMIRAARRRDPDFDLKLIGGVVDFNLRYGRDEAEEIRRCKICGEPTSGEVCTVCKLRMRLSARLNTTPP